MNHWFLACAAAIAVLAAPTWTTHKDPLGFSVELPPGWKAAADRKTGRVDLLGPRQQQVTVWPVFIPGSLEAGPAARVLLKMGALLDPAAAWGAPQPAGPSALRVAGRSAARASVAAFTWVNSPKGAAGWMYLLAAPPAAYRQQEDDFARILRGFRPAGQPPAQGGSLPALSWTRFQEPRESAWSFEAPAGWPVQGGLYRFASVDVRSAWEVRSPDGLVRVSGGDAEIPYFTEPTQMLLMTGFREGSWYSPGYGVNLMVRRYVPGAAFAREYVPRAARGCAEIAITENRERPETVQAINAIYAQYGSFLSFRLTAGDAAFTCRKDGQPMRGYYFAGTQRVQAAGIDGGIWNAEHLAGFLAREDKVPLAQAVLNHVLETIQLNPQWMQMQQQITANTSKIVSRTNAEISKTISTSYWNRQAVMDEISRRRSNATLGVYDVVDPATGREFKVESSSNYYWMDHRGAVVGTETYTRPDLDFRELIRLP